MKAVIFGADRLGIDFYFEVRKEEEVIAFVDNAPGKQGQEILGIQIIPAEKLICLEFDRIYIASQYHHKEITVQVKELGVPEDKISYVPVVECQQREALEQLFQFQETYQETAYQAVWREIEGKYKSIKLYRLGVNAIGEVISRFFTIYNTCEGDEVLRVFIPDSEYVHRICNTYLVRLLRRKIYLIQENEIDCWAYILKKYKTKLDFSEYHKYDCRKSFPVYQRLVGTKEDWFTVEERQTGQTALKQMGIDRPYVCIGARSDAYNRKTIGHDFSYDFRNMSFNDYHKALEYLQQQNVVAVRMGRMETPMEEMENCIDYAGYYADDFRDLYVTSECMFMIVNACGIFSLASFFSKPLLMVNAVPITFGMSGIQYTNMDLYIPKKYYDINKKRYLSLREMIQVEIQCSIWGEKYDEKGIKFIDNTQEEIAAATQEMLERLTGKWQDNEEDKENYSKYMEIYQEMREAAADNLDNWTGEPLPYRLAAGYLRENRYLLI